MGIISRTAVEVTQTVYVTVDEAEFTPEFMAEFRESFYPFYGLGQHLEHLGQLYARGMVDDDSFIEGYGPAADMGIRFEEGHTETQIAND